jgi:quercetin dioxygenase-like cupin family protein
MTLYLRRQLLQVTGVLVAMPSAARIGFAQAPAGPKLTQILKKDVEGQGQAAQETVVSVVEFGPRISAPWHMHPSAQEALYALDGDLVVEVDGRGTATVKLGEAYIIPGDIPHLARNESTSASVRALAVHTRGVKDKPFVTLVQR